MQNINNTKKHSENLIGKLTGGRVPEGNSSWLMLKLFRYLSDPVWPQSSRGGLGSFKSSMNVTAFYILKHIKLTTFTMY